MLLTLQVYVVKIIWEPTWNRKLKKSVENYVRISWLIFVLRKRYYVLAAMFSWGLTAVTVLSNSFSDVSSSSQLFCQLTMPSKGGVNGFFFIWKSLNKTSLKVNIDQTNRYHCQQNPPTDNCENTCDMFLPCPSWPRLFTLKLLRFSPLTKSDIFRQQVRH